MFLHIKGKAQPHSRSQIQNYTNRCSAALNSLNLRVNLVLSPNIFLVLHLTCISSVCLRHCIWNSIMIYARSNTFFCKSTAVSRYICKTVRTRTGSMKTPFLRNVCRLFDNSSFLKIYAPQVEPGGGRSREMLLLSSLQYLLQYNGYNKITNVLCV